MSLTFKHVCLSKRFFKSDQSHSNWVKDIPFYSNHKTKLIDEYTVDYCNVIDYITV